MSRKNGTTYICRRDAKLFPKQVIGKGELLFPSTLLIGVLEMKEWPGEFWFDIRKFDLLAPVFKARLTEAKQKGCDGIDFDNMDGSFFYNTNLVF